MRGRAEAARRAHNPEVSGSNPLPATKSKPEYIILWFFVNPAYCGGKSHTQQEKFNMNLNSSDAFTLSKSNTGILKIIKVEGLA